MSQEKLLNDLMGRLNALDDSAVQLRMGVCTDDSPLTITLGGASTPYVGVQSLSALTPGDRVAVLAAGNRLLVLGALI